MPRNYEALLLSDVFMLHGGEVEPAVLKVLQNAEEAGGQIAYYWLNDVAIMSDPTFGPDVAVTSLAYNSELGLHIAKTPPSR